MPVERFGPYVVLEQLASGGIGRILASDLKENEAPNPAPVPRTRWASRTSSVGAPRRNGGRGARVRAVGPWPSGPVLTVRRALRCGGGAGDGAFHRPSVVHRV